MGILIIALFVNALIGGVIDAYAPDSSREIYSVIPQLGLAGIIGYHIFKQAKVPINLITIGWMLAYIGSVVWDHDMEFYIITFLILPGLLSIVRNYRAYSGMGLVSVTRFTFPILVQPIESIRSFFLAIIPRFLPLSKKQTSSTHGSEKPLTDESLSFPVGRTIGLGVIFGLIILLILIGFDSDFATFLQVSNWDLLLFSTIGGFLSSLFIFFWLAWHPCYITPRDSHKHPYSLRLFLQGIIVISTAVLIGYSIYDAYIFMRIAGFIELMFESIGNNTRLYYIELMGLGGVLLFLSSYFANGLWGTASSKLTKRKIYIILLIVATLFLIPPLINLFRVLLMIYIPEFGLSARRLFGIYTGTAFVVAAVTFWWYLLKQKQAPFAAVVISFFFTLSVLTYVIPSNYLIFSSHLQRYHSGQEADFQTASQIDLSKSTWMIPTEAIITDTSMATDIAWEYSVAQQSPNEQRKEAAKERLTQTIESSAKTIDQYVTTWDYQAIAKIYGLNDTFVAYSGPAPKSISIRTNQSDFVENAFTQLYGEEDSFGSTPLVSEVLYPVQYTYQTTILDTMDPQPQEPFADQIEDLPATQPAGIQPTEVTRQNEFALIFAVYADQRRPTLFRLSKLNGHPVLDYYDPSQRDSDCQDCQPTPPSTSELEEYLAN